MGLYIHMNRADEQAALELNKVQRTAIKWKTNDLITLIYSPWGTLKVDTMSLTSADCKIREPREGFLRKWHFSSGQKGKWALPRWSWEWGFLAAGKECAKAQDREEKKNTLKGTKQRAVTQGKLIEMLGGRSSRALKNMYHSEKKKWKPWRVLSRWVIELDL